MLGLVVGLAAYDSLDGVISDWEAFERVAARGAMVDGALVERSEVEVTRFHARSVLGWGRGVIASAVCGVLWPPALVVGALAGGVGGDVMTAVRLGLTGDSVRVLGDVLEAGPFVAVAVVETGTAMPDEFGRGALSRANVPLRTTSSQLVRALRADDDRDR